MSHYVHHVPGRLRIKSPYLKRNSQRAAEVQSLLDAHEGIVSSEVSVLTGSVVIIYNKESTTAETIMAMLQDNAQLAVKPPPQAPTANGKVTNTVASVGDNVAKALFGFAVEKALERSAVALIGAIL